MARNRRRKRSLLEDPKKGAKLRKIRAGMPKREVRPLKSLTDVRRAKKGSQGGGGGTAFHSVRKGGGFGCRRCVVCLMAGRSKVATCLTPPFQPF